MGERSKNIGKMWTSHSSVIGHTGLGHRFLGIAAKSPHSSLLVPSALKPCQMLPLHIEAQELRKVVQGLIHLHITCIHFLSGISSLITSFCSLPSPPGWGEGFFSNLGKILLAIILVVFLLGSQKNGLIFL